MSQNYKVIYFRDSKTGIEPFRKWVDGLKDKRGQARIFSRIARAVSGNFGDHKSVGQGVNELRIPIGPGYRVYYAIEDRKIILLLVGGDKSTQSKDIKRAQAYWKAHTKEKSDG